MRLRTRSCTPRCAACSAHATEARAHSPTAPRATQHRYVVNRAGPQTHLRLIIQQLRNKRVGPFVFELDDRPIARESPLPDLLSDADAR